MSGEDAGLIQATALDPDLGFVGDIARVDPELLLRLLAEDLVPVVATIGSDETGQAYNINADTAAGAIADALGAEKLVFLTDVEGIRARPDDPAQPAEPSQRAPSSAPSSTRGPWPAGWSPRPGRPSTPSTGVWRRPTSSTAGPPMPLLLEIFTSSGIGTMVTSPMSPPDDDLRGPGGDLRARPGLLPVGRRRAGATSTSCPGWR